MSGFRARDEYICLNTPADIYLSVEEASALLEMAKSYLKNRERSGIQSVIDRFQFTAKFIGKKVHIFVRGIEVYSCRVEEMRRELKRALAESSKVMVF